MRMVGQSQQIRNPGISNTVFTSLSALLLLAVASLVFVSSAFAQGADLPDPIGEIDDLGIFDQPGSASGSQNAEAPMILKSYMNGLESEVAQSGGGVGGNDKSSLSTVGSPFHSPKASSNSESGYINLEKLNGTSKGDVVLQAPDSSIMNDGSLLTKANAALSSPTAQMMATVKMVEPMIGESQVDALTFVSNSTRDVLAAQDAFLQSAAQDPENREVVVKAFSGCVQERIKSGQSWSASALECMGGDGADPFALENHPASPIRSGLDEEGGEGVVLISQIIFNPAINRLANPDEGDVSSESVEEIEKLQTMKQEFVNLLGDVEFKIAKGDGDSPANVRTIQTRQIGPAEGYSFQELFDRQYKLTLKTLASVMGKRCEYLRSAFGGDSFVLDDNFNPFDKKFRNFWSTVWNSSAYGPPTPNAVESAEVAQLSTRGYQLTTVAGELLYGLVMDDDSLKSKETGKIDCAAIANEGDKLLAGNTEALQESSQERFKKFKEFAQLIAAGQVYGTYYDLGQVIYGLTALPSARSTLTSIAAARVGQMLTAAVKSEDLEAVMLSNVGELRRFFEELSNKRAKITGRKATVLGNSIGNESQHKPNDTGFGN